MLPNHEILALVTRADNQGDTVDGERQSLRAIFGEAKAAGLQPAGMKAAMKLRKLKPQTMKAYLDTFDAVRLAIGLDNQLDLEDSIAAAKAADRDLADGNGEVPSERPARRDRGRVRQPTTDAVGRA